MKPRCLTALLLLYVVLDFADPLTPSGVYFPEGSLEAVQVRASPRAVRPMMTPSVPMAETAKPVGDVLAPRLLNADRDSPPEVLVHRVPIHARDSTSPPPAEDH